MDYTRDPVEHSGPPADRADEPLRWEREREIVALSMTAEDIGEELLEVGALVKFVQARDEEAIGRAVLAVMDAWADRVANLRADDRVAEEIDAEEAVRRAFGQSQIDTKAAALKYIATSARLSQLVGAPFDLSRCADLCDSVTGSKS